MKRLAELKKMLDIFIEETNKHAISAYSAQASFFLFLSFFPFVMFFLTLLNYLPFDIRTVLELEIVFLPPEISAFLTTAVNEIYNKSSGALISVTTVTALWSASKGFLGIIGGFNAVYSATEKRGYIKLRITALFYTIILVVVLTATLGFLVFGNRISNWFKAHTLHSDAWQNSFGISDGIRWVIAVVILILFFMYIYTVVPERKTRFISELPGAVVSSLGWVIFSAIFSFYINNFANFHFIYGNLTSIVILMLWLYFCMTILFIGAEINCIIKDKKIKSVYKRFIN